jgi:hypothetical protein
MRLIGNEDKQRWLECRRQGLGGSDAAAIMGMGATRYAKPSKVWQSKVLPPEDEGDVAPIMVMGQYAELGHIALLREQYGLTIETHAPYTVCVRENVEWMRATLDGVVMTPTGPAVLELKRFVNRDEAGFPEVEFGVVRDVDDSTTEWDRPAAGRSEEQARAAWLSAYIQTQWNMMVTGWDTAYLSVEGRTSVYCYRIAASMDDQQDLYTGAKAFWFNHVKAEVPPPVTEDDLGLGLADRYYAPRDVEDVMLDDEDWGALYEAHAVLKKEASRARGGADALRERFKRALEGAPAGVHNGTRYYINGNGVWSRRKVNNG